mgnify:CR=1 FL=1
MKQTTLCYLERDGQYLMLHRVKKEHDENHDKWIGVGGKFERFESPEDCLLREVKEETGLTLTHWRSRGLLTFIWGNMTEFIHLYTADGWTGEMIQGDACREGVLHFVEVKTRTNLSCGLPREYVTPQKQQRLRKTAAWYLMVKDLDCPARFDVAEVYAEGPHPQKAARIEYIENAF